MINLVIDVGNSFTKAGLFINGKLHNVRSFEENEYQSKIDQMLDKYHINQVIVSRTGKLDKHWYERLQNNVDVLEFDQTTNVPFENFYKTPQTLGLDRIALISAAAELYPDKDVLIIDAGTCITYDFINSKKQYYGGMISPGWKMRFEAMHEKTDKLPLLQSPENLTIPGVSTASAMYAGVVKGLLFEIDGFIDTYKAAHSDIIPILTGGDGYRLSTQLKNDIFVNSNFLMLGLNTILEHNLLHD